ncbi:MAG: type II secretion system F family protein [Planctomycetota bacterium]|jgi:type IV pilus assembly protein PilC
MFENDTQETNSSTAVSNNVGQRQHPPRWQQTDQDNKDASEKGSGSNLDTPKSGLEKLQSFRIDFGPSRKDVLNFTKQLSVMVKAGISIQESLEAIGSETKNERFKKVILDLKDRIEAGESFSQALREHSEVFSSLYVNMVGAAEVSGSLSDMLEKLAGYLDQEAETRSQVKGAMVYPIIIAVMAVCVTVFLLTFVLPRFTAIFQGKEHLLPKPTILLMGMSTFLRHYWFFVVPAIGGAFAGFLYFIRTEIGCYWWDQTKLRLPLLKTLCRNLYITRSLHTMGVLVHAGVPILDTISITAHISGNTLYRDMWLAVHEDIRQGGKIATSLRQFNLMPVNVVQMIRSGEDSGTMSDVLQDVSGFYARELKTIIKTVTSMIEPIMIVVMGVLVGFIAMSIILPIFKMSNAVMGH